MEAKKEINKTGLFLYETSGKIGRKTLGLEFWKDLRRLFKKKLNKSRYNEYRFLKKTLVNVLKKAAKEVLHNCLTS